MASVKLVINTSELYFSTMVPVEHLDYTIMPKSVGAVAEQLVECLLR